ncbi:related to dead-box protein precursor CYT-19 [Cephalotrichum gorgonifer]|uniref:ATP-dependent RNA helicase n=1 Tax=Cephalotrichum gorgonifer TaxID=2041049 RepID=A0AAE8MV67_9PEZI|nr:related to dead-box protein precursor CYT-19 [Cephalotrichum gorgonifer]
MLRLGLRRCAPVGRARFAIPTLPQCQSMVPQVARIQQVTVLPALRNAFHQSRTLSQNATAEAVAPPPESERMRFEDVKGVHPNLIRSITEGMQYTHMSEVQEQTIVAALSGKDMVAQARTGTGKTLAFLLPMMQRMIDSDPSLANRSSSRSARPNDIRGIVISPTRELAEQIAAEARRLVRGTGLVVQSAVGGTGKREMLRNLQRQGCHLLVATPGRLYDLLSDPHAGVEAPNLDALVLDEADRMLDVGFADTLADIQSKLPDIRQKVRQTLLFSATIPSNVVHLAKAMVRQDQFEFVQTIKGDDAPTHARIPQNIAICKSMINLFPTLYELLDREMAKAAADPGARPFKAIIYFGTTAMVETAVALDNALRRDRGHTFTQSPTLFIHGKLQQNQRTRAANAFRRARSAILLSSDVTARGIDFPDVTHVIQVGLPSSREQYIHRLGRTGRQDKEGEGWLIIPEAEAREAASLLRGLGLKDNGGLASERAVVESEEDMSPIFKEVTDAFGSVPYSSLAPAYLAWFGNKSSREVRESIEGLNKWATLGWGKQTPPSVRTDWLRRRGLQNVPGFNVSDDRRPERDSNSSFDGSRYSRDGESRIAEGGGWDAFQGQFQSSDRRGRSDRRPGGGRSGGRSGGRDFGNRGSSRPPRSSNPWEKRDREFDF